MDDVQFKQKSMNKGFFLGVGLILITVFGYVFLVGPLAKGVAVLKDEVDSKEVMVSSINSEIEAMKEASVELGDSSDVERNNILKMIPIGPHQDDVIRALTKEGAKNDVILNSLSFNNVPSKKAGVGIMRANASFEAAYVDLAAFLKDLETSSRLLNVDSINVQVSRLALAGERVNFSLVIEAYYQK